MDNFPEGLQAREGRIAKALELVRAPEVTRACDLRLVPGIECFTPTPLPRGARFRVTVRDIYLYLFFNAGEDEWGRCDACYDAGDGPNFGTCHKGIRIDGEVVEPYDEDRDKHVYDFCYVGRGAKASILVTPPQGRSFVKLPERIRGRAQWLSCEVRPLEGGDAEYFDAYMARRDAERREAQEASWSGRVRELTHQYAAFAHYADDTWLGHYAVRNRENLISRRHRIVAAHDAFHADPDFIDFLKAQHPETYLRACWEARALALADTARETPEEYRRRHDERAWDEMRGELDLEEQAVRQAVARRLWADDLRRRLIEEGHPQEVVEAVLARHRAHASNGGHDGHDREADSTPPPGVQIYE